MNLERARLAEGRLQVRDEVGGVLDTDREADQPAPPPRPLPLGSGYRGMGHPCGVLGQRFDRAERLREGEDLQPLQGAEGGRLVGELEAHHAAEHSHLARGDRAVGMRLEARVIDTFTGAALGETGVRLARAPPRRGAPPMYSVVLCTTTSAPRCSG